MSSYSFVRLSVSLSIHPRIYPSIYLSIYLSIRPSINPSIHPSVYISAFPSVHLSVYASVCLSVCLSVRLPMLVTSHAHLKFDLIQSNRYHCVIVDFIFIPIYCSSGHIVHIAYRQYPAKSGAHVRPGKTLVDVPEVRLFI
jgi:hypothetical protein